MFSTLIFSVITEFSSQLGVEAEGQLQVGGMYMLTCTLMGAPSGDVQLEFFDPDGAVVTGDSNVVVGPISRMGDTLTRTLTFNSLSADDVGTYSCRSGELVAPIQLFLIGK